MTTNLMELFAGPHLDEAVRDYMAKDLAGESAEELAAQFGRTTHVLDGLLVAAEAMDLTTYTVLNDARARAAEAYKRAATAAGVRVLDV